MKSAYQLEEIVEGRDYTKDQSKNTFYALHCTQTNAEETIIQSYGNRDGEIRFPPGSFVKGAIYPIMFRKLIKAGGVKFIGYRTSGNSFFE